MQITNTLNLPAAFVHAVSTERHNAPHCYSATTLNKGAKEIVLTDRHYDEITVDASEQVWAVFGTAVHRIMQGQDEIFLLQLLRSFLDEWKKDEPEIDEPATAPYIKRVIQRMQARIKAKAAKNEFCEERFDVAVANSHVTGQVDLYDMERGIINDWKTASVWKVQFADFADWRAQGLTYAWLLTKSGLEVKKCRFVALLKDHSKTKAKHDASYPQSPVFVYEFDVTAEDLAATEARIISKVTEIENAYKLGDDDIEPCTLEERWADGEKYAVMKNGRKTAVKLFDNQQDAEAYAGELGNSHYVEHRPAVSRKCEDYCSCCDFCNFYKSMHKGEN